MTVWCGYRDQTIQMIKDIQNRIEKSFLNHSLIHNNSFLNDSIFKTNFTLMNCSKIFSISIVLQDSFWVIEFVQKIIELFCHQWKYPNFWIDWWVIHGGMVVIAWAWGRFEVSIVDRIVYGKKWLVEVFKVEFANWKAIECFFIVVLTLLLDAVQFVVTHFFRCE